MKNKSNLITLAVVVFILIRQLPSWLNHLKLQGNEIPSEIHQSLSTADTRVSFPLKNKRTLAIFWASWCGPCKVEMSRLKTSVDDGAISKDQIYAINPFESEIEIRKFVKQTGYPFIFIQAPQVSEALDIRITPTTLLLDGNIIKSISSGISLIGIWRAEFFLKSEGH